MPNPWMIIGALGIIAAVSFQTYRMGQAACEAAHNQRELERIEEGERLKEERRYLESQLDDLTRQLQEEADAEPVTVVQCLSPSRVMRLNKPVRQE